MSERAGKGRLCALAAETESCSNAVKWLVMDVDGTLTDGRIYIGPDGETMKVFNVRDGYAIAQMLPAMCIVPMIITGRQSAIVERRCQELGVTRLYQGVQDKLSMLSKLLAHEGLALSDVAYIGDDLNDLPCIKEVNRAGGVSACPADAACEVREESKLVLSTTGGYGAVRELVDILQGRRTRIV